MQVDRIYAEIFESHYKKVKSDLLSHDYASARRNLILAAKGLYEVARESDGQTREERLAEADALYRQIFTLDNMISREKEKKLRKASAPEKEIMPKNTQKESASDDDSKIFQPLPVPDLSFDDVIGLRDAKEAVRKKIIEPRLYPELYERYKMKRGGGILMFGPPGTGKTMIAKAIAHEANAVFFAVSCSELVSKYFGGTEQNIKALFDTARTYESAVIFFDEIEALAIGRDRSRSTIMRRVVSELLTQMQGIRSDNQKSSLLILAATNTPWLIDSAFMRPGRFDERIYVGLPDEDARRGIIEKNLDAIPKKESLNLDAIVEATEGFNCSDVAQLVTKAKSYPVEREKQSGSYDGICMQDFEDALETTHSSVIMEDYKKILEWKKANG